MFFVDISEDYSDSVAMTKSHADLIKSLGDGTRVAELLTAAGAPVERDAVYKWKNNGVPWKYRNVVARLAEQADKPLPPGFLGDMAEVQA